MESGLFSLRMAAGGSVIEIAMVGLQGVLGAFVVLGGCAAPHQSVALIDGSALRISVDDLLRVSKERPAIRDHLLSYMQKLMIHGSQLVLCASRHTIDQRLACWLCLACDALNSGILPITHDHLSVNLGLRRAGITEALARFEELGLIRKMRGVLDIRERSRLASHACCCYRVISTAYRAELPRPVSAIGLSK